MNADRYDSELQKVLRISEETFAKEESLREQAKRLELDIARKKKAKWNGEKSYGALIQLMEWQPLFINRGVGCGIQNLGNSCFMNATLQCLAYTPPFAQLMCQTMHSQRCRSKSFCALCATEKVITHILMGKEIVRPSNLFKHLPQINDLLHPGCQEDAHEFLQSLLDRIEMAFDDQQRPQRRKDPQNPIRSLFTGTTKTAIQCVRCRRKSVTTEPFCCISLDIDKTDVDLAEALEIFTRDELLRGEDKYSCDFCHRKCVAHKRMTLAELPPILALHFKRFSVHFEAAHHRQGTLKKMAAHVDFPEVLDFEKLQHVIFEEDRDTALIDSEYELYAVLVHSGPQLGYGHYYALIRSPDGYWFRMNDMEVIPVTTKRVLREQGFIVFYRRKTTNLMQRRLKRIRAARSVGAAEDDESANNECDADGLGGGDEQKEAPKGGNRGGPRYSLYSQLSTLSVSQLSALRAHCRSNVERCSRTIEAPQHQKQENVMREALETMEAERARIREIDDLIEGRRADAVKVDDSDLTHDYFASTCEGSVADENMVIVDQVEAQRMGSLSAMPDRSAYVHVPPMATRPELFGDVHRQRAEGDGPDAVEVFWPFEAV